ncbi:MAG TPA: hypothetical protein VFB13_17815 [Reyranella sp.]|nr:hypothetical protein [Reyranella sp.]
MDYPKREPDIVTIGTTWAWRRDDLNDDFPGGSGGWTLAYTLSQNGQTALQVNGAAVTYDGEGYLIKTAANLAAAAAAGLWTITGQVTNTGTGEVYEVYRGTVRLLPALGNNVDGRTYWQITLDNIEAVIQGRATKDQMAYTIDGRRLDRTPIAELLLLKDDARAEVERERRALLLSQGRDPKRKIGTRFVGPTGPFSWPWPF